MGLLRGRRDAGGTKYRMREKMFEIAPGQDEARSFSPSPSASTR
jgi:hypothetical protein